jgi:hypothetical protein
MEDLPSSLSQLDVSTMAGETTLSRWGWIPQVSISSCLVPEQFKTKHLQCSDIQFTPQGGTPPYAVTVRQFHQRHFTEIWPKANLNATGGASTPEAS